MTPTMLRVCLGGLLASIVVSADGPTLLQFGRPTERTLSGAETHAYGLALDAGQVARLTVVQKGIDVIVHVRDAQGTLLADFNLESRTEGREPLIVLGEAAGPVQIGIAARYPRLPGGTYAIQVDTIQLASERDRDEFAAHALSTSAGTLESAGKFAEAKQAYMDALARAERTLAPHDAFLGQLLTHCGEIQRSTGDTAAAERLFQRAVDVNVAVHGREDPETAFALRRQGALYTALNDYAKAEPLLEEALAITERTLGRDHPWVAAAILPAVMPHYFREDFGYVIPLTKRALAIAERTLDPDDFTITSLVNNLGDFYSRIGEYDAAEPYSLRALAAIEKRSGPDSWRVANPLFTLTRIYRSRQQFDRALELGWRAYRVRESALGAQHPDTAAALILIGNTYLAQGDFAKATDTFERVLAVVEARGPYFDYTQKTLQYAAAAYAAQGDLGRALNYQARANRLFAKSIALNLATGSERERLQLATAEVSTLNRTISMHIRQAPDNAEAAAQAIELLLQRKGQVFDALSGSLETLRQRMTADDGALFNQLRATTSQLATLALSGPGRTPPDDYKQQLATLEARRDELEAAVSSRSAEFRAQSLPVTVAAVQAAIPADAALIEFAIYHPISPSTLEEDDSAPPHYIAYVIRRHGAVRWIELGAADAIEKAVEAWRQALRDPTRTDVTRLARAADERILRPLRPLAGHATRLLISPDGALNLIPFEALVDERHHYAVQQFAISYLTSGRDLLRLQVPRASRSAPLVVANPSFGPEALTTTRTRRSSITTGPDLSVVYFAPLPGTAAEARAVKTVFPAATVLTGGDATKTALIHADAPTLLHIATHGFFLQNATAQADRTPDGTHGTRAVAASASVENPLLRSGLALSGANLRTSAGGNGILTALEATTLNLWGTRLVTLSGCDTGVGDVRNGEGVFGLRRAFLLAGAESLVMSLWSVSDSATRDMMTAYYGGLQRGLGRGDALRQAQLAMLKRSEHQHPFYWASFIQAGDWRPFETNQPAY